MGETPCPGCPISGPCCLDVQDTIILLVALTLLVQVVLKIVMVICRQLWRLLTGLGGILVPKAPPSPLPDATIRKPRCPTHDPSPISPGDRRSPPWELPLPWLCPWKPVRLTMDVNLHQDPPQHDREPPRGRPDALGPYHNCTCPQAASAPSALPRNASRPKPRPATISRGTDARPVPGLRFHPTSREELALSGAKSQRQRPTKVYIYPVHPETPPGSRDPSPGRRELRWQDSAGRPAGGARQSRDPATDTTEEGAAEKPALPGGHARYFKVQEPSMQDWVYRPIKEPQWNWNQVG
ncbi:WAS/WASL-interacting protein family member 3-like [Dermochelys coriacea]|uniref:WAS/WASL-interacting protein family member 3-like n=1 Tax=Dermochelys coriacea TaxID=27794 RepID=UPI001CAA327D|nr:WAS/WASL-interacting protein family member 3-like [Dermochelys coriacea]